MGEQCPSPYSGRATIVAGDAGADAGIELFYGTSCASASGACGPIRLDKRGCPIFVTFESCGGDICLGSQRIARPADAGAAEEDAGSEQDGGEATGAGAH